MTKDQVVAETIIQQMGGIGKLVAMVGAKGFVSTKNSVGFKFKMCRKANFFRVTLNGDDTYTVEFIKVGKCDFKTVEEIDGVYWEQLKPMFERFTGLYLSL